MEHSPRWNRPFSAYTNAELRAVKFRSVKEFDRAIDLLWSDPDLKGMPNRTPDGKTLIVPKEGVAILISKRFKFTVSELLNRDELGPGELAEMRRKHGM